MLTLIFGPCTCVIKQAEARSALRGLSHKQAEQIVGKTQRQSVSHPAIYCNADGRLHSHFSPVPHKHTVFFKEKTGVLVQVKSDGLKGISVSLLWPLCNWMDVFFFWWFGENVGYIRGSMIRWVVSWGDNRPWQTRWLWGSVGSRTCFEDHTSITISHIEF